MSKHRREKGDANASPDSSKPTGVQSAPSNNVTELRNFVKVIFVFGDDFEVPLVFEEQRKANDLVHDIENYLNTEQKVYKLELDSGEIVLLPLDKLIYVCTKFVKKKVRINNE